MGFLSKSLRLPGGAVHHDARPHGGRGHREDSHQHPVRASKLHIESQGLAVLVADALQDLVSFLSRDLLQSDVRTGWDVSDPQTAALKNITAVQTSSPVGLLSAILRQGFKHEKTSHWLMHHGCHSPISGSPRVTCRHPCHCSLQRGSCTAPLRHVTVPRGLACLRSMLSPRSKSSSPLGLGNSALMVMPSTLYAGCRPPDSSSTLLEPQMFRKALSLCSPLFTRLAILYLGSSWEQRHRHHAICQRADPRLTFETWCRCMTHTIMYV